MRTPPSRSPAASPAVIVMGVSGSGKSTVGDLLARELHAGFLEGDRFHAPEAVAKMRSGEALTDDDRWPWLDRIGSAIRSAAGDGRGVVAACSALRRSYRDRLIAAAGVPVRFVLLAGGRDELLRRLKSRTGHYMPASLLDSQLATLEPLGPMEPGITLDAALPPDMLARAALDWLGAPLPQGETG